MMHLTSCEHLLNVLMESVDYGMFRAEKAFLYDDIIEIGGYPPEVNVGTEIVLDDQHPNFIFCITEDLGDGNFQLTLDKYRMIVDQNPGVILPMKYRQPILDILKGGHYY